MDSNSTSSPDLIISVVPKEPDITIPVRAYTELLQAKLERDAISQLLYRSDTYAFRDNVALFLGIPAAQIKRMDNAKPKLTPKPQQEPTPAAVSSSEPPTDTTGEV